MSRGSIGITIQAFISGDLESIESLITRYRQKIFLLGSMMKNQSSIVLFQFSKDVNKNTIVHQNVKSCVSLLLFFMMVVSLLLLFTLSVFIRSEPVRRYDKQSK